MELYKFLLTRLTAKAMLRFLSACFRYALLACCTCPKNLRSFLRTQSLCHLLCIRTALRQRCKSKKKKTQSVKKTFSHKKTQRNKNKKKNISCHRHSSTANTATTSDGDKTHQEKNIKISHISSFISHGL